jgi:hypothetical protein
LRRFSAARSLSVIVSILESLVTVDQPGDIGAEQALDLLDSGQRVFHGVVEKRGHDGFLIELQLGHQARHFDRVREVGVAARPLLGAVLLHGIDIGTVEHGLVRLGGVGQHTFDKFILAQHFTP